MLLDHGAEPGLVSEDQVMLKLERRGVDALHQTSLYRGTAYWYAMGMDHVNVLTILLQHKQHDPKRFKVKHLLVLAIDAHAITCATYLRGVLEDKRLEQVRKAALHLACKRGIEFIQLLLSADEFSVLIEHDPNVLNTYYTNVGIWGFNNICSCATFTRMILESCSNISEKRTKIRKQVDSKLLRCLLSRNLQFISMSRLSKDAVMEVYSDIRQTLVLLVNYEHSLPDSLPEAIGIVISLTHELCKRDSGYIQRVEALEQIKLVSLLVDLGFGQSGYIISLLPAVVTFPSHLAPAPSIGLPNLEFITEYVALVNKCITLEQKCVKVIHTSVFSSFVHKTFAFPIDNRIGFCLPHQAALFTSVLDVLCGTGLNVNLDTEPYFLSHHNFTCFQSLIIASQRFLNRSEMRLQPGKYLLAAYTIMAGQRVNFLKEARTDNWGMFTKAFSAIINAEYLCRTAVIPREYGDSIMHGVVRFIRFVLSRIQHADRGKLANSLTTSIQGRAAETPAKEHVLNEMHQLMVNTFDVLLHIPTLKDICVSVIRRQLFYCQIRVVEENRALSPCYPACIEWPEFAEGLANVKETGLQIGHKTALETQLMFLRLPRYIHEYVLGFSDMLETILYILESGSNDF